MKCLGVAHCQWSLMANLWLIETQHKGIKNADFSHMLISPPFNPGLDPRLETGWKRDVSTPHSHSHMQMQFLVDLDKMSVFSHFFSMWTRIFYPYLIFIHVLWLLFSASHHFGERLWAHHHLTLGRHPRTEGHCRFISQNLGVLCVHPAIFPRPLGQIKMGNWKMLFLPDQRTESIVINNCVTWVQGPPSPGERFQRQKWTVDRAGHINEMRPVTLLLQIQRSY